MIKDTMAKNAAATPTAAKIAALRELLPGCFGADGSLDFGRLREELGGSTATTDDGYSLHFLGRDYANLLASVDTETVIQPDEEHNSRPENRHSQNIYISGDNLDALKHLLRSYARRVKCIYIDPPYNTGTDGFVYADRFSFTPVQLTSRLGISDEEARRTIDMTSRHSASHSAWLAFMSPRLQLARDLLAPDGVIFISIDDNEQANLRLLCDRVFGESCFIGSFIWKKRQMVDSRTKNGASTDHDYLLCYGRTEQCGIRGKEADKAKYTNPDNDPRGPWMSADMTGLATASQRPNLHYDLQDPATGKTYPCPPTGWRYDRKHMAQLIEGSEVLFPANGTGRPRRKKFLKDVKSEFTGFSTLLNTVYSTQGTRELRDLFGGNDYFDFPKPVDYIKQIIEQGVAPSSEKATYVVDFFSGSGTTAQAVMELNAENDTDIRHIMVQLQEPLREQSDAYKAGFRTIDQIGMERIKLAAKKIREDHPGTEADLGFRHFTLHDVPQDVLDHIEKFDPQQAGFADNTLQAFGRATVLATWMERDGYGLCAEAEPTDLAGYTAYSCGDHLYLLDEGLTPEAVTALVDRYAAPGPWCPHNVVLFGYNFTFGQTDALRTNLPLLEDGEKQVKVNIDVRY